jgi:hypothetical protein
MEGAMAADPRARMGLLLRIIADARCSRGDLAVAGALLVHCYNSTTGRCDPSKRTLAAMTGMSGRNVAKRARHLVALGHFRVAVGGGTPTRYGATNAYVPVFEGVAARRSDGAGDIPQGMNPGSWDERQFTPQQGVNASSSDELQFPNGVNPSSPKHGKRTWNIEGAACRTLGDLKLDDLLTTWAAKNTSAVNIEKELEKFRDWCAAKGRTFKNYRSAFRNWLRRAQEFAEQRRGGRGQAGLC